MPWPSTRRWSPTTRLGELRADTTVASRYAPSRGITAHRRRRERPVAEVPRARSPRAWRGAELGGCRRAGEGRRVPRGRGSSHATCSPRVRLSCLKRQGTGVSARGTGPPAASHPSPLARPSKSSWAPLPVLRGLVRAPHSSAHLRARPPARGSGPCAPGGRSGLGWRRSCSGRRDRSPTSARGRAGLRARPRRGCLSGALASR